MGRMRMGGGCEAEGIAMTRQSSHAASTGCAHFSETFLTLFYMFFCALLNFIFFSPLIFLFCIFFASISRTFIFLSRINIWKEYLYSPGTDIKMLCYVYLHAAPDLGSRSMVMAGVLCEHPQAQTSAGRAATVRS